MISPATGHGTGPTHLELSTVATLLPASTLRPTFFGLTEMMPLARFCATSVRPTVTTPPSWRAPKYFSTQLYKSSGGFPLLTLAPLPPLSGSSVFPGGPPPTPTAPARSRQGLTGAGCAHYTPTY